MTGICVACRLHKYFLFWEFAADFRDDYSRNKQTKTGLITNKLPLNLSKPKILLFGRNNTKSHVELIIDNTQIETVNEIKFLV